MQTVAAAFECNHANDLKMLNKYELAAHTQPLHLACARARTHPKSRPFGWSTQTMRGLFAAAGSNMYNTQFYDYLVHAKHALCECPTTYVQGYKWDVILK